MQRLATITTSGILGTVLLTFLTLTTASVPGGQPAGRTGVLAVLSSDSAIYEEGLSGIRSAASAKLEIVYLNILRDEQPDTGAYFRRTDRSGKFALVVAIGEAAAREVYAHVKNTTVVFTMISVPKAMPESEKGLCGVSMHIPASEYFRVLKEIAPGARKVRAFFTTEKGRFLAGEGEYSDLQHGLIYTSERVDDPSNFQALLERRLGQMDAVYMVADPLYDRRRFRRLSDFARKNKIVLMTGFSSLVRAGATFGLSPDYNKIGSITGRMIERIVSGHSTCRKEGIVLPDRSAFFFYLNEKFAKRSGVRIPTVIKERARLVRLLRAGIDFFNEGKFKSARIVFEAILERDPGNSAALYYRDRIIAKLSGTAVRVLLKQASDYLRTGKLNAARVAYQRALRINPRLRAARLGLVRVSRLQHAKGRKFYESGRVFEGLRFLSAAVRSNPDNSAAAADLSRVRRRERRRVPVLLRRGQERYSGRDYGAALGFFSKVLLLSPGNKTAREYQRLARKKKAAIERLRRKLRRLSR